MKRRKSLLVVLTAVVLCVGGVALAKAVKVDLNPIGSDPGGGFVIFNETSGPDGIQIQMSLKGALPRTTYDVYVQLGAGDIQVGTITTNVKGNANFHYSGSRVSGQYEDWVGLGLNSTVISF